MRLASEALKQKFRRERQELHASVAPMDVIRARTPIPFQAIGSEEDGDERRTSLDLLLMRGAEVPRAAC